MRGSSGRRVISATRQHIQKGFQIGFKPSRHVDYITTPDRATRSLSRADPDIPGEHPCESCWRTLEKGTSECPYCGAAQDVAPSSSSSEEAQQDAACDEDDQDAACDATNESTKVAVSRSTPVAPAQVAVARVSMLRLRAFYGAR